MTCFLRIAMLAIVVQLGQPELCGNGTAAQTLDSSTYELLTKHNLKILHIGNSFTFDTTCYLPEIVKGTEADVSNYKKWRSKAFFFREKTAFSGRENGFLYETKRLSLIEKTAFFMPIPHLLTFSLEMPLFKGDSRGEV